MNQIKLWLLSQRMNGQPNVAVPIRAEGKAGIGVDGGVALRDGNRHKIAFQPVEHFFKLSILLQLFTEKSEAVELLPIHFLRVYGGGILLHGQEVLKTHLTVRQLPFILRCFPVQKHHAEIVHAQFHIVCQHLVQPKVGRIVELLQKILHEVL
ncbi:hypothetical protein SAMN05216455_11410 [Segatella bryantii]|nr:hypothetical protein SAMN05216455_11410 [Segatella bryantii]